MLMAAILPMRPLDLEAPADSCSRVGAYGSRALSVDLDQKRYCIVAKDTLQPVASVSAKWICVL